MFLVSDIINILLTELSRSVWESLHLGHGMQTDLTGFRLHSRPWSRFSHTNLRTRLIHVRAAVIIIWSFDVHLLSIECWIHLQNWRSFPGCTVHVDSTDVKRILFILGVKSAQVEEIYDLSKSFKGCVQYGQRFKT